LREELLEKVLPAAFIEDAVAWGRQCSIIIQSICYGTWTGSRMLGFESCVYYIMAA
jgi:hypothetical protein